MLQAASSRRCCSWASSPSWMTLSPRDAAITGKTPRCGLPKSTTTSYPSRDPERRRDPHHVHVRDGALALPLAVGDAERAACLAHLAGDPTPTYALLAQARGA